MGRPPFQLSDEQASHIARGVAELDALLPRDQRNHRPFVREFIRIIHSATGKLYSPSIYHRLLGAYAPTRRPSTATIATERDKVGLLLTPAIQEPLRQFSGSDAGLAEALRSAVADAIELQLGRIAAAGEGFEHSKLDFYRNRLNEAETAIKATRAEVLRLSAELAAAKQSAEQWEAEAMASRELQTKSLETIAALNVSADENRKFALIAIDESRGETRTWKERCIELELQRAKDLQAVDAMRRRLNE